MTTRSKNSFQSTAEKSSSKVSRADPQHMTEDEDEDELISDELELLDMPGI